MADRFAVGRVTWHPRVAYRVLATDWEAETSTECWTEALNDAKRIACALKVRDVSVQIDAIDRGVTPPRPANVPTVGQAADEGDQASALVG